MAKLLLEDPAASNADALWADTRLIMLGTIHRDREGADLLSRWLSRLRPEVVTLEFSQYGMIFRKTHRQRLHAKVDRLVAEMKKKGEPISSHALAALEDYIDVPYEYDVASKYADDTVVPFHLLDLDASSYVRLQKMDELLAPENIRALLNGHGDAVDGAQKEKILARLFFKKSTKAFSYTDEMLVRDRYIASRLALLMKQHQGKRILHVCGWQHLSDPHNVYGAFNPVKVFMYDTTFRV